MENPSIPLYRLRSLAVALANHLHKYLGCIYCEQISKMRLAFHNKEESHAVGRYQNIRYIENPAV